MVQFLNLTPHNVDQAFTWDNAAKNPQTTGKRKGKGKENQKGKGKRKREKGRGKKEKEQNTPALF